MSFLACDERGPSHTYHGRSSELRLPTSHAVDGIEKDRPKMDVNAPVDYGESGQTLSHDWVLAKLLGEVDGRDGEVHFCEWPGAISFALGANRHVAASG